MVEHIRDKQTAIARFDMILRQLPMSDGLHLTLESPKPEYKNHVTWVSVVYNDIKNGELQVIPMFRHATDYPKVLRGMPEFVPTRVGPLVASYGSMQEARQIFEKLVTTIFDGDSFHECVSIQLRYKKRGAHRFCNDCPQQLTCLGT